MKKKKKKKTPDSAAAPMLDGDGRFGANDDMFASDDDDDEAAPRDAAPRSRFDYDPDDTIEPFHLRSEARDGVVTREGDYIPRARGARDGAADNAEFGGEDEDDKWVDGYEQANPLDAVERANLKFKAAAGEAPKVGSNVAERGAAAQQAVNRVRDALAKPSGAALTAVEAAGLIETLAAALERDEETVPLAMRRLSKAGGGNGTSGSGSGTAKKSGRTQQQQQQPAVVTAEAAAAAASIEAITGAADTLMGAGYTDVYTHTRREMLARLAPPPGAYRFVWSDDAAAEIHGPCDLDTEIAGWVRAGYISDERPVWLLAGDDTRRQRLNTAALLARIGDGGPQSQ
jgi:hypothetical protein